MASLEKEVKEFESSRIGKDRKVVSFIKNSNHANLYHVKDEGSGKRHKNMVLRVYPMDLSRGVGSDTLNMSLSWNLRHPNIVRTYDLELLNRDGHHSLLFFLLERSQGSLLDWLKSKPETNHTQKLVGMMYDVIQGVWFLHQNQLLHENLHPGNIQFFPKGLKISDFYHTKLMQSRGLVPANYVGPVSEYTAPELFYGKTPYSTSADMWSVGVIIFEMLFQKLPFDDKKYRKKSTVKSRQWLKGIWDVLGVPPITWRKKYTGKEESDHHAVPQKTLQDHFKEPCCGFQPELFGLTMDLLSNLIELDPAKRLTADQALRHPIFLEFQFQPDYGKSAKLPRVKCVSSQTKELKEWRKQMIMKAVQDHELEIVDYHASLMGVWLFDACQCYFHEYFKSVDQVRTFFCACMWIASKLMTQGDKMGGIMCQFNQRKWKEVIYYESCILNCIRFVFPYDKIRSMKVNQKTLTGLAQKTFRLSNKMT